MSVRRRAARPADRRHWWRRPPVTLTRRGTGVLCTGAALGAAWFGVGIRDLWYLAALLVALVMVAAIIVISLPRAARLRPILTTDDPTPTAGTRFAVALQVHARLPATIPVELEWAAGGGRQRLVAGPETTAPRIVTCTAHRRGPLRVGVGALIVQDPLGLARHRVRSRAGLDVLVLPALVHDLPEPRGGVSVHGASAAPAGRTTAQVSGEPSGSVREYRTGDAIRQVHWKQSARQGQLLVNVPEDAEVSERTILIDTDPASYAAPRVGEAADAAVGAPDAEPDAPAADRFEHAVSTAATLAVHWQREGHPVRLIVGHGEAHGLDAPDDALILLARATLSTETDDHPLPRIDAVVTGRATPELWERLPDPGVELYAVSDIGAGHGA
ncbi:DUF58 domain-containing protein [Leucobacter sp. Psy1]|uniref:DUF58 domain-containing protein n=1 Tax=Leucobacter sp. Psy1 TaxID=2875729 RepID=UPI001CD6ED51|nr:DUF58 domain-containing protein [Leucobacter sp. Psy1]